MQIGLVSLRIKWKNSEQNLKHISEIFSLANENGIKFLIFPEMCTTGFITDVDDLTKYAEDEKNVIDFFKKHVEKYNISVLAGFLSKKENTFLNQSIFIDSTKSDITKYAKIHLFSYNDEDKFITHGNEVVFFKRGGITFSNFICYDLRFPEIFQIASEKSDIIVVIANWPDERIEHWNTLLKARAIENQSYVIGVNCKGEDDSGNVYNSDPLIFDSFGKSVALSKIDDELFSWKIERNLTDKIKDQRIKFPVKNDRKEQLYKHLKRL